MASLPELDEGEKDLFHPKECFPVGKEDLSKTLFNYNCKDWDNLLLSCLVESDLPKDQLEEPFFSRDNFLRDLGQVLHRHRVTLKPDVRYTDFWGDEGTLSLVVTRGEEVLLNLREEFPVRRKPVK